MNEQLKKLVEQAGFEISSSNFADLGWVWCSDEYPIDKQLERFAELVRDDEREACAKLCDDLQLTDLVIRDWADGTYDCAKTIRARGNK
jgi:hypothetical protein